MQWTSLGGQWMDRSRWMLLGDEEGRDFPPKDNVQKILDKHAPNSQVVAHRGRLLEIALSIHAPIEARASIANDLRQAVLAVS